MYELPNTEKQSVNFSGIDFSGFNEDTKRKIDEIVNQFMTQFYYDAKIYGEDKNERGI